MEKFNGKLVIGLTGENGAGKETFTRLLTEFAEEKQKTIGIETFSSILFETLESWHISTTRGNLQELPRIMIQAYGDNVLADAVYQRILERDENIIILDGARRESDLAMIKKFPNNIFIYITAEPEIRWKRLLLRGQKTGEKEKTWEQFLEEEKAESELEISKIGASADFKIVNNGTMEEYRKQVEEFYSTYVQSS
ncbi:hypothetical protein A2769_01435 [Candidatus Daviesbacteria bacterium RIFCSPHIGHO2_01_FULL_37_27]|nr:MAG: hypothetical protein A2769_01435 [Candidatus Daviesbacteria bacterium RIFCSPHIGHO2_01_FULL_37_27]